MSIIATEILLIVLLVLANGVFALSEIALISARKARLQQRADAGDAGARAALQLAADPARFLSTVQIGISLIGILAGAFGGATLAETIGAGLSRFPALVPYGEAIGLGVVVLGITYLSLVVGELAPKRLALNDPERIASAVARPMSALAQVVAPAVQLLTASTELLLRLLGVRPAPESPVTVEEIKILIDQGRSVGVFEAAEQDIVESALHLDDRRAGELISPRTEIVWVDLDDPPEKIQQVILSSPHAFFPAARGHLDNVVGILRGRDWLARQMTGQPESLEVILRPPLFVPESLSVLDVLQLFKHSGQQVALVIDEYGGLQGLATLTDVMAALVGDIRPADGSSEPAVIQREDGSWLLDGRLAMGEVKAVLGLAELPDEGPAGYDTLGGFIMTMLGRIPSTGDWFERAGYRFEVADMDGRRVDRVLVGPGTGPAEK